MFRLEKGGRENWKRASRKKEKKKRKKHLFPNTCKVGGLRVSTVCIFVVFFFAFYCVCVVGEVSEGRRKMEAVARHQAMHP